MSIDLMIITNDPGIAQIAEEAGVERIFLDYEMLGKEERQGHLDTHIAQHSFSDINSVQKATDNCDVMARINPVHDNTQDEIEKAIEHGADTIMLPMFKTVDEIKRFVDLVHGRVNTSLLLETAPAMVRAREIADVEGIDEIHIGLNDLHLSMELDFMFEPLSGGIVEYLSNIFKKRNIRWGFGGIAKIGEGDLPAEHILAEHVRLDSQMVILSRTFHEKSKTVEELEERVNFAEEVAKLREKEKEIRNWPEEKFEENQRVINEKVKEIVYNIRSDNS